MCQFASCPQDLDLAIWTSRMVNFFSYFTGTEMGTYQMAYRSVGHIASRRAIKPGEHPARQAKQTGR